MEGRILYFAYGSNMASDVFVARRGMQPLSSQKAALQGYRLAFNEPGIPYIEPAFANVEPADGQYVEGVAYDISKEEFEKLLRSEGGGAYRVVTGIARTGRGDEIRVSTLAARFPRAGLSPSKRYIDLMIQGAEEFKLSREWIEMIRSTSSVDRPIARLIFSPLLPIMGKLFELGLPNPLLLFRSRNATVSGS